ALRAPAPRPRGRAGARPARRARRAHAAVRRAHPGRPPRRRLTRTACRAGSGGATRGYGRSMTEPQTDGAAAPGAPTLQDLVDEAAFVSHEHQLHLADLHGDDAWNADLVAGTLTFTAPDGGTTTCRVQFLGTAAPRHQVGGPGRGPATTSTASPTAC